MVPYCRVLTDNLQAALDAQFDSKARTIRHSYGKYNSWEVVKSKSLPLYQLGTIASVVKIASDMLPAFFPFPLLFHPLIW